MKKAIEIIKIITYYILLFIFSGISYGFFPVGAIAMVTTVYASGGILAPALVLSAISVGITLGIKSLLILILFSIVFLIPVIFIRPLVSIEGRNEKRKVANYLLLASLVSFAFFGFLQGVYAVLLVYILYKIFVNTMTVLRNEDEKLVFSKEESIGLAVLLSMALLYVFSFFNLPLIIAIALIFGILGYTSIKKGIVESLLSYFFVIIIYYFIIIPIMNVNINIEEILNFESIILLVLPLLIFSLISLLRRFNRIVIYYSLALINIGLFLLLYKYMESAIYYLPYILMSFSVLIFADDYEKIKADKIKNSNLITDEGETRLETPISSKFGNKLADEEKEKLKSREVIELFTDKDVFVNRMYINEDLYKDLSLYDELQASDYIFEEIYDLIKEEGYINRKKFHNILLNNNIIIDIYNYEMEEEIRILEILSLRELKRVVREKEEKKVFAEREQALQNDKKINESIEETDSIEYNKKIRNDSKKESIRDIFKDKK